MISIKPHILMFAVAALYAVLVVVVTTSYHIWPTDWTTNRLAPPIGKWHGHEMIFGFALAVMGGYFSGAIRGPRAFMLIPAWIVSRIAFWFSAGEPVIMVPLVLLYPILLFMFAGLPLLRAAKSWRNAVFGYILAAFPLAELLFVLPLDRILNLPGTPPLTAGIFLLSLMIFTMGGRIIAAATSGALRKRGYQIIHPAQSDLETPGILLIVSLIFAVIIDTPEGGISLLSAGLAGIVLLRLWRWRVWSIRDASVLSLHAGYAWLAIGFMLNALHPYVAGFSETGNLHALTIGSIGTLTLSVMMRVILQRARQPVVLGVTGLTALILVNIAAILRIFAPFTDIWTDMITGAAACWCIAFLLFLMFVARNTLLNRG
ncbi:MAG: NnrS family protein [Fimbriimonadaceae bacterium]|nr:NnrS family protein [Alphaproteobacteria bacterium]